MPSQLLTKVEDDYDVVEAGLQKQLSIQLKWWPELFWLTKIGRF